MIVPRVSATFSGQLLNMTSSWPEAESAKRPESAPEQEANKKSKQETPSQESEVLFQSLE